MHVFEGVELKLVRGEKLFWPARAKIFPPPGHFFQFFLFLSLGWPSLQGEGELPPPPAQPGELPPQFYDVDRLCLDPQTFNPCCLITTHATLLEKRLIYRGHSVYVCREASRLKMEKLAAQAIIKRQPMVTNM